MTRSDYIIEIMQTVRKYLVDYQTYRGVSRTESVSFGTLLTSLCSTTYIASITVLVILWNFSPIADGLVYLMKFVLENLIEISETPDEQQKIVKSIIFAGEMMCVPLIVILVVGVIFIPVYFTTIKFVNSFWS